MNPISVIPRKATQSAFVTFKPAGSNQDRGRFAFVLVENDDVVTGLGAGADEITTLAQLVDLTHEYVSWDYSMDELRQLASLERQQYDADTQRILASVF